MKTIELVNIANAIAMLQREPTNYPIKFGFALAINARAVQPVVAAYEAARFELAKKFGLKKEDGTLEIDDHGNVRLFDTTAFVAELNSLGAEEVDVSVKRIMFADLPETLPVAAVQALLPLIISEE